MNRAVTVLFENPEDERKVDEFVREIVEHCSTAKVPRAAILHYGKKIEFCMLGSNHFNELLRWRSATWIGNYQGANCGVDRVKEDVREALRDYFGDSLAR